MEYSLPDTVIETENVEENKTIFLLSRKPHYSGVQFCEQEFDETAAAANEPISEPDSTLYPIDHINVTESEPDSEPESEPESFMDSLNEEELVLLHEECLRMFGEYFDEQTEILEETTNI